MNWIDVSLIMVVILTTWAGWNKGFIVGMLDLVSWVGSVIAGLYFYQHLGSFFQKNIPSLGVWTLPVAFLAIILLARIIFSFMTQAFLKAMPVKAHKDSANRLFGIIPGAINGVINATILAALLLAVPVSDDLSNSARDSKIAGKLATQVEWLDARLSPIFDEAIRRSMNNLTVHPESEKSVKLHYTVATPRVRPDLETEMLELVNEERRKLGLKILIADPEMAQVARAHSRDMFARGYFSHVTPEGYTLSDRVKTAGVSFLTAGENLALGPTLAICHDGLMKSPAHKKNILHPAYGRLGIGVLDGGKYGLIITQNFRN
ncbi:MAG: CvpA family protein [Flavitalea sp.]